MKLKQDYNPLSKSTNEILEELMSKYFVGMCANSGWTLSLEDFAITSISLINYLTMSNQLTIEQRKDAAMYLCKEFNRGFTPPIDDFFLDGLAEEIIKNDSIEMDRIKFLIDNIHLVK